LFPEQVFQSSIRITSVKKKHVSKVNKACQNLSLKRPLVTFHRSKVGSAAKRKGGQHWQREMI